jgi:dihydropyrimidine dehydrogenase (NAD+) subunit PreT
VGADARGPGGEHARGVPTATVPEWRDLRPALTAGEAMPEADRCLDCRGPYAVAPCTLACPAGIDVPRFVTALAGGDVEEAARTIYAENLLASTCARVCPVEVLCEGACVLHHEGRRPVEIARLQRYAADEALARGVPPRTCVAASGSRVAVVGAGPAGLVCAGELAALGHHVTVFDERDEVGGLARFAIAPYRLQREPLEEEAAALEALGVEIRRASAIDTPEKLRELERDFEAIFLGVGLGDDVDVRYEGDEREGVWSSLRFIERLKRDLPLDLGERVVVVGGGNTAVDVAREARALGARVVTLAYRRTEAEMPAYAHEVEEAREEGVEFLFLANPIRLEGNGRVEAVVCQEMRLGEPGADGRRRPEPVPGSEVRIAADTVVKAIGQRPRAEFLSWIEGLELEGSRIRVDAEGRTGNPLYFSGGDATSGGATVVEGVADAKRAARAIDRMLRSAP